MNKETPKIEKTEVQTICPLGETIPDFTQEIEKFKENNNQHKINNDEGDSCLSASADRKPSDTSNGSIMNDGFSTPNCEICKDYPKEYWCGNPKNKLSLKEQENKDDFELGKKEGIRFTNIKNKKLLSSLQEKIERLKIRETISYPTMLNHRYISERDFIKFKEEISKIFQEMEEC
jgi:hypothetical protein